MSGKALFSALLLLASCSMDRDNGAERTVPEKPELFTETDRNIISEIDSCEITCHVLAAKSVIYENLSELPDSLREETISQSLEPFSIHILNEHWGGEIKFTRDDDKLSYKTYESYGETYYDIPHKVVLDVRNWDTGKEYKQEITRKNVRMMPGEAYYDFQVLKPSICLVTDSKIVFTVDIVKMETDEGDCLEVTVSNDGVQIKNMDIVPGDGE